MGTWGPVDEPRRTTTAPVVRTVARSEDDRVWRGVCGGIAEFAGLDSGMVRLAAVVGCMVAGGVVVPAYLIAGFFLPSRHHDGAIAERPRPFGSTLPKVEPRLLGWVLVGLGVWLLLPHLGISHAVVLAVALVALGVDLVFRHR